MTAVAGMLDYLRGVQGVLAPSSEPLLRFQRLRLASLDGYLLSRIDGRTSFADLAACRRSTRRRRPGWSTPCSPPGSSSWASRGPRLAGVEPAAGRPAGLEPTAIAELAARLARSTTIASSA